MVNIRYATITVIAAIVCFVGASERGRATPGQRFVIGVESGTSLGAVVAGIDHIGLDASRLDDLHALEVTAVPSARTTIASVAGVRYVEPVVAVQSADAPNDPLYGQQSSYLSKINASAAWDITTGSANVVVAVVDTGVDVRHPDLQPNIWFNPREIANNGTDDDGNGCVDDVNGCAFVSDSAPGCSNITNGFINDDIGHGTFVAGIIAAVSNGQGIVGVARNVRIMPVKVLDCYGSGDSIAAARGIQYAARNGAKVINLSLGGLENAQVMRDAVIEAMSLGSIVIAASGNGGGPGVAFPAAFPESLAVAAAAPGGDTRASFSSYGPEVDVAAVGEDVVGTMASTRCGVFIPCIGNTPYASGDGTSFSTPQVSGLAALIYSLNPNLTAFQVTDIIRNSATALAPGNAPNWAGAGRINMLAALQAVQGNHPPGEACTIATVVDGESFTCTSGRSIRMLQMDAPDAGQCGGQWATDALRNIFLTPGRTVYLRFDVTRGDAQGRTLAAPLWRGNDGQDYNISIIMVYVGLARAADVGATNTTFHDWSFASETWAKAASWNMWAAGKPFTGGC